MGSEIFHLDENDKHNKIVLHTIIFNVFVFLQVFNEINCQRIDDSLNVFKDIFHDYIFIIIQIVVIVGQLLIVEFGGVAFGTTRLMACHCINRIPFVAYRVYHKVDT